MFVNRNVRIDAIYLHLLLLINAMYAIFPWSSTATEQSGATMYSKFAVRLSATPPTPEVTSKTLAKL